MKKFAVSLLAFTLLAAFGCGEKTAMAPYDSDSLWHMQQGRDYAAEGRFELAKEHYVLALAASKDPRMRTRITEELDAVNKMIITLR